MTDYYDAFEISPVPPRDPDAVAPEPFRGIYAMPSFVTIPAPDLPASVEFWTRGLGFIELFSVPGGIVHLRRWAFQDVLLVPAGDAPAPPPAMSVSFACVLRQIEPVAAACRALRADAVDGPRDTPWGTRDLEIRTPENARVVFTAPLPWDPESDAARHLAELGITAPDAAREQNGEHAR
ncbi:VOC family protein [Microbacterium sp. JZ70]|uniref:VOC family protein n=1 Tax=Microbacterium TaxID=33882 RepID=UPI0024AF8126|nr:MULTISPECIES: VOC family protein [Microbacterium]MDI6943011.1 VOC family protein [Microbacterium barkeri]WRH17022.1 VOC family protein [Microbacterium sp. JZ37]